MKTNITNNTTYMLINLVRSYDNYHIKNKFIHLIGSVFYTSSLDTSLLDRDLNRKSIGCM